MVLGKPTFAKGVLQQSALELFLTSLIVKLDLPLSYFGGSTPLAKVLLCVT